MSGVFRSRLPQLDDDLFLADGGLETTLVFHRGLDLPFFAAFDLLRSPAGRAAITEYFHQYVQLAREAGTGLVLESPTWRASADWGRNLGYDDTALADVNRSAIALMTGIRDGLENGSRPLVISGNLGPRGDGYVVSERMSVEEARAYHGPQVRTFSETEADLVSAFTMTYPEEAAGIALAAREAEIPSVISFTTETDGRLPDGQPLRDAIRQVDAATDSAPAYYMVNCAHPDHFHDALNREENWVRRIRGIRANASRMSHAELDQAEELDIGDPAELGQLYRALRDRLPHINILGGCCGTDHRHIGQIGHYCAAA